MFKRILNLFKKKEILPQPSLLNELHQSNLEYLEKQKKEWDPVKYADKMVPDIIKEIKSHAKSGKTEYFFCFGNFFGADYKKDANFSYEPPSKYKKPCLSEIQKRTEGLGLNAYISKDSVRIYWS